MPESAMTRTTMTRLAIAALALLASCAHDQVIVDTQNVDQARYRQDLEQCQAYAEQASTGKKVASGAAGGAAVGGVLGAIFGNRTSVARGAGTGAVIGGTQGAVSGAESKHQIVRNCLQGRGYQVLN